MKFYLGVKCRVWSLGSLPKRESWKRIFKEGREKIISTYKNLSDRPLNFTCLWSFGKHCVLQILDKTTFWSPHRKQEHRIDICSYRCVTRVRMRRGNLFIRPRYPWSDLCVRSLKLSERRLWNFTDVTLADEDTNSILLKMPIGHSKAMHYTFSEKEVQKCSTLNSCFSTDFHRKIVKFCTKLS